MPSGSSAFLPRLDHLAVGQDDRRPGDVMGGEAVLQAVRPPEFSATLPPIVQTCWLDGSGA